MKWNVISSGFFAATTLAVPTVSRSEKISNHLAARDAPLWAANFTNAADSNGAGFGRVQFQYYNDSLLPQPGPGTIDNNGPPIPVVTHPELGRALRIHLNGRSPGTVGPEMRWEAQPPKSVMYYKEGEERYFRVDFVLDPDFPVDVTQTKSNVISQIHQAKDCCGSPPVSFGIRRGMIVVRGQNTSFQPPVEYSVDLARAQVDTKYKLVFRVKFSATEKESLLEAWLNDQPVLTNYQPKTATLDGGDSYWKGATLYCFQEIPPETVYQTNHRVGLTKASVDT